MSTASTTGHLKTLLEAIKETNTNDPVAIRMFEALERITVAETESAARIQVAKIRPEPLTAQAVENVMGYTGRGAAR